MLEGNGLQNAMKPKVYVETSVVSYLTARPSKSLLAAAWQAVTADWWATRRELFDLYTSQLAFDEAREGDVDAARRRLEVLREIPLLEIADDVSSLARRFIGKASLPSAASDDALHIAIATVHGMDFLLTWNCTHIANAEILPFLRRVALSAGYELPVICTPEGLMGGEHDEEGSDY